jgi:hypothetical protein
MCDITDKINARAYENLMRIQLEQEQQDKIKEFGATCRAFADKGVLFNEGEADLFYKSLYSWDFAQCERLIKTLKARGSK